MSFLDKIGLGPKKAPEAPTIGKKKKEESTDFKDNIYVRIGIIVVFFALLFVAIPRPSFNQHFDYQIGEPWMEEDLIAPFTFAILKSEKQLERERQAVRQNTPPIYHRSSRAPADAHTLLNSIFQQINTIVQIYRQSSIASDSTTLQKKQFIHQINAAGISLSDGAWETILSPDFNVSRLHETIDEIINDIFRDGIINQPKSQVRTQVITIRNLGNQTQRTISIANVRDVQQASGYAKSRLAGIYRTDITQVGIEIFNRVIVPNLIYQAKETEQRIATALANISGTKGAVGRGEIIIRTGDIVTPQKSQILKSLAKARSQNATDLERWLKIGGDILVLLAIFVIFFFYLYLYRRKIFKDNALLSLVLLTIAVICVSSAILFQFTGVPLYIVPIAIAPIILTIIFDSRLGILTTVALALTIGLISNESYEFVTATIVACTLGLFSVRDIKQRSQFFFITPGIVFISYAMVIIGFSLGGFQGWEAFFDKLIYIFLNTLFILFTYPLILIFERTFNVTTDLTLIELADTNLPLLNNLMTKAPGTFHHSLQVSNLAEAAAGAIRANSLLCRVGALYHDIGKMENPEYFTENQRNTNELEKLKPRMSALVIKAHVTNGKKLANENHLPDVVIDFIKTHHGTSTIKYFYEKALKQSEDDKDEIKIKDFRYDGPLPRTKETGIVMLADCTEAASRSMDDPNYQKLKNLIDKLVDERVQNGQLGETPLTFRDLTIIKKTFLNILIGIYHSRVDHQGDEEEKKKKRKKAKKTKKEKLDKNIRETKPVEEKVDSYYNS